MQGIKFIYLFIYYKFLVERLYKPERYITKYIIIHYIKVNNAILIAIIKYITDKTINTYATNM